MGADVMKVSLELQARGIPEYTRGMRDAETATGRLGHATTTLSAATDRYAASLAGMVTGGTLAAIGTASVQAALGMERLEARYKAATGSGATAAREMGFVREEAERLGLVFSSTADQYGQFIASTRNTSVEGAPARRIFAGVSEAVSALKLSSEAAQGIFTSMTQMLSKGTVQAEEMTGQLGERLPGALDAAARAMDTTRAEFLKMVQDGEVLPNEFLPKLAEELHKTYGKAATESASQGQAAINRFKNEVFETGDAIGQHLTPAVTSFSNAGSSALREFRRQLTEFEKDNWADKIWRIAGAINAAASPFSRLPVESFRENDARALAVRSPGSANNASEYARQQREAEQERQRNAARAAAERAAAERSRARASEVGSGQTYQRYNEYVREHNGLVDDQRKLLEEIDTLRRGGTVNLEKEYREMNRINDQVSDFVASHKEYEKPLVNSVQRYAEILDYLVKANEELRTRNQLEAEVSAASTGFDFNSRVSQGFLNYKAAESYTASLLPSELQRQRGNPYSLLTSMESRGAEPTATDPGDYGQYIREFGTDQEKSFQGTVDRVDSLGAYLDQGVISHQEYFAKVEALYEEHNNRVSEFDRMKAENALMTTTNMMEGLSATLMQGSKEQFEIGKGLAITSAIIETVMGAQKAYTAMVGLGPAGPALGAAAAGVAMAMGMARVSMISSQQYTPRRALGGDVEPGYGYEVGERGREVFVPWQRGQIIPNGQIQTDNYSGGRSDKVVQITNHFNVGENTDRRSRQQIASESGAAIMRAMRRLN